MGDALPLNIAQQASLTLPTATSANTISLSAMLLSAPDVLTTISRPITVTGTIVDMLISGELSLRTAMGTINLSIETIQNDTLKVLMDLIDTPSGKSPTIELFVQPGAVPKQALLILPKADPMRSLSDGKTPDNHTPVPLIATLQDKGDKALKVTILPDDIDSKAIIVTKNAAVSSDTKSLFPSSANAKTPESTQNKTTLIAAQQANEDRERGPTSNVLKKDIPSESHKILSQEHQLKVTLHKSLPADAQWSEPTSPDQIKATVIGKNAHGQTLLHAEGKTLFIHDKIDLPTGTKLILTAKPLEIESTLVLPPHADQNFEPARALVAALQATHPDVARSFLNSRLPTPQHHFAGTALFLLSAIHGGQLDEWMGTQTIQTLERESKTGVKNKLIESLREIADTSASDARVGEWKSYPIPIHYGQAFEMLRLYVHHDAKRQSEHTSQQAQIIKTRFVISVTLSQLGPIQLDGLCQKKQLDFVVRSERELPDHLTMTIRDSALKSLEAVGLTGTILFQAGRQNWVVIEDNRIRPASVLT